MTLRALSDRRDVRFEDDTFDVRNQRVRSRIDDEAIGTVDDVLIDDSGRTRYLSVKVEGENRRVLLPAGETEADRTKNVIWVPALNRQSLTRLPAYEGNPSTIDADYERRLQSSYEQAYPEDRHHERADYRSQHWGSARTDGRNLERVDQLSDIDVASGEPDPRGWNVVGHDGRELGRIENLIGDTKAMRVRYLVMRTDASILEDGRNVLIPVGQVDLDTARNRVVVSALDANVLKTLPAWTGQAITTEEERKICANFGAGCTGERQYQHPRYRDENLYGRSAPANERKMTRSEEELRVGRPATGRAAAPRIGDQEIVVPVTKEEVVVEKRPQVKEEIVVRKRDVAQRQVVEGDVRKERVNVDEHTSRR